MNSIVGKIVAIILSILLLIYIGIQVFNVLYMPYETETVMMSTYSQNVTLNGFFVRNEQVLPDQKSGVINYKYKNGEKIPKDSVIADVYSKESDLYSIKQIERLEQEKQVYEKLKGSQTVEGSKIDLITKQVNLSVLDLIGQVENGDLSSVNKIKDDLTFNLNKIDMSIDNTLNFDSRIAYIDAEIAAVNAGMTKNISHISSAQSGYFSNAVDGYEEAFSFDMLDKLTVADVQTLVEPKESFAPKNIGKLQLDADWYFVSTIDSRYIEGMKPGHTITLTFASKAVTVVDVTVADIITEKNNPQSVIVMYSNYIDEGLMSMRFEQPQAVLGNYTGIVIPKETVRMSNIKKTIVDEVTQEESVVDTQVKGVYTLLGKTVRFKEIDPIYEDGYVVVSRPNDGASYVSVYDKVIIKGKDLNEPVK